MKFEPEHGLCRMIRKILSVVFFSRRWGYWVLGSGCAAEGIELWVVSRRVQEDLRKAGHLVDEVNSMSQRDEAAKCKALLASAEDIMRNIRSHCGERHPEISYIGNLIRFKSFVMEKAPPNPS